jgi:hypothetical protein
LFSEKLTLDYLTVGILTQTGEVFQRVLVKAVILRRIEEFYPASAATVPQNLKESEIKNRN